MEAKFVALKPRDIKVGDINKQGQLDVSWDVNLDKIKDADSSNSLRFKPALYKDGSKVSTHNWTHENSCSFDLIYEPGIYYVQIDVIEKDLRYVIRSLPKAIFSEMDIEKYNNEFDEVIKENKCYESCNKLVPSKGGFADLLICKTRDQALSEKIRIEIDRDVELRLFEMHSFHDLIGVTTANASVPYEIPKDTSLFSGWWFNSQRNSDGVGPNVNSRNVSYEKGVTLHDGFINSEDTRYPGTFSALSISSNEVQFFCDFHGSQKLTYFKNENFEIVTNRYHLLLTFLKTIDQKTVLNTDKAFSLLSCKYHNVFSHNFTSKSLLNGARQLKVEEFLSVKDGEFRIKKSSCIANCLKSSSSAENPLIRNSEKYTDLVKESAEEIVSFMQACLDSVDYKSFVVDLSGGLDSRLVYAALTNCSLSRDNVYVNIRKTKDQNDHIVALQVNSLYGIPFYTANNGLRTFKKLKRSDIISFIAESKYFRPFLHKSEAQDTLILNGFYGEPSLRKRGSDQILHGYNYPCKISTIEDLEEYYTPMALASKTILTDEYSSTHLSDLYYDELRSIGGESLSEKLETHYLTFSHAYHASESFKSGMSTSSASVLKSPKLFELFRLSLSSIPDVAVAFDVLKQLNPIIARFPFENPKYNELVEKLDFFDSSKDPNYLKNIQVSMFSIEQELSAWEQSQLKLKSNTKYLNLDLAKSEVNDRKASYLLFNKILKSDPVRFSRLKHQVVHFLKNCRSDLDIGSFRNKLETICLHL